MNLGFWSKLKIPFTVLAPMANVTDFAFRQIVTKCGRPDVFYTEFISCDGIINAGKDKFAGELYHEKSESPIVVQFFGANPENFYKCAQLAKELGYDGIDVNMGCPDKSVEKQGGGAALIKNPKLAQELIQAAKEGGGSLPISVKTRLGYNKIETEDWIPKLLETGLAALSIHGRTRKEMSKVPAHWDEIAKAKKIALAKDTETLIIGNGDVKDMDNLEQKAIEYNLDGIMVGRGIFDNPWFFSGREVNSPKERIELMIEHINNFEKLWGPNPEKPLCGLGASKNYDVLKRFFKIYISGWPGAKELRTEIMATKSGQEVKNIVDLYLKNNMLY